MRFVLHEHEHEPPSQTRNDRQKESPTFQGSSLALLSLVWLGYLHTFPSCLWSSLVLLFSSAPVLLPPISLIIQLLTIRQACREELSRHCYFYEKDEKENCRSIVSQSDNNIAVKGWLRFRIFFCLALLWNSRSLGFLRNQVDDKFKTVRVRRG